METSTENLERILVARDFGPHYYPDLFRMLRELELVFLLPYHPEMLGETVTLKNGDQLPQFAVWDSSDQGRRVPIFSSPRLANDACKAIGAEPHEFALASMPGEGLFQLLACQPDAIVLNPACHTNAVFLDLASVRRLGDGSIFRSELGERQQSRVEPLDPADYPTNFVQELFSFLKQRPRVRATWIFRTVPEEGAAFEYVFVLDAEGDWLEVEREFRVVASAACAKDSQYGVAPLDPANKALVTLTAQTTPFFARPGYVPHAMPKRKRRKKL